VKQRSTTVPGASSPTSPKPSILGPPCRNCGHWKAEHTGGPCTHMDNSKTCGCTNYVPMKETTDADS
jgi:hypothetical protein